MTSYVALLRAVNVSGKSSIRMDTLRSLFDGLGYEDVATYVQSGNVAFTSSARSAPKVAQTIMRGIADQLGLDVAVLVRTAAELASIVAANPLKGKNADPSKLHVTFLERAPASAKAKGLDPLIAAPDELAIVGREVFLHCPGGYGRTKLNNSFFEKQLGVMATTRNWKTVQTLFDLAGRT